MKPRKIEISSNTVVKFNKLFKEVLEYYDLDNIRLYVDSFNKMEVFNVSEFANQCGIRLADNKHTTCLNFIQYHYPKLLPFFELYFLYYDSTGDMSEAQIILKKINDVMMYIRYTSQKPIIPIFRKKT